MKGIPTHVIAKELSVSIGTVEQLLTQHPMLVALRRRYKFNNKQDFHRKLLITAIENNPELSRQQLKNKLNSSYLWLFKNDKSWLYSHLPVSKHQKGTKR